MKPLYYCRIQPCLLAQALVKMLDGWVGTPVGSTLRFSVAAAVMTPASCVLGYLDRRLFSMSLALESLEIGRCIAAELVVQAIALETPQAGLQAFLLSLSRVACPLLEPLFWGRKQPARMWLADALATRGVAGLGLGHGDLQGFASTPGDLIGLLQPLVIGMAYFSCNTCGVE